VYLAPTVMGATARPAFELPQALRSLDERARFAYRDVRAVGGDLRLTLRAEEG